MDFMTLASTERVASNNRVVAVFLSVVPAVYCLQVSPAQLVGA